MIALDLIEKMIAYDPKKRISAGDALTHRYVAPYHDPSDEPEAEEKFDWSFDENALQINDWQTLM